MTTVSPSTPIGAVIAYAGVIDSDTTTALAAIGWLPCDGSLYDMTTYQALYQVLQTLDGGDGATQFAVPDYRGMFLRAVDGGSGRDPDAASRTQPRTGLANNGTQGDSPGSLQGYACATHTHTYSWNSERSFMKYPNGNDAYSNATSSTSTQGPSIAGSEQRPVNAYVNYLICYSNTVGFAVPVGAIIAYAGWVDTAALAAAGNWMSCDGTLLAPGSCETLAKAIGTSFGGTSTQFALPDLRGCFLRGVDSGRGRDPDTTARTAPRPTLASAGNTGDAVGSMQEGAMDNHSHSLSQYASESNENTKGGTAKYIAKYGSSNWEATSWAGTSGAENRPKNSYVYWLIKSA